MEIPQLTVFISALQEQLFLFASAEEICLCVCLEMLNLRNLSTQFSETWWKV